MYFSLALWFCAYSMSYRHSGAHLGKPDRAHDSQHLLNIDTYKKTLKRQNKQNANIGGWGSEGSYISEKQAAANVESSVLLYAG